MIVTIFGATGRTGRHLISPALEAGYQVRAFVRNPAKLTRQHERLVVLPGELTDAAQVEAAVAGADAVISVLGPTANRPDYLVSRGTAHIISAMERHGVRRLVVSAGAGVPDPQDKPGLFDKLIGLLVRTVSRHVFEDMVRTVTAVRRSSLDWTIVRVPMLTDSGSDGRIRVGYVGKGTGPRIARADVAAFMLRQLADDAYLRQAPVISN